MPSDRGPSLRPNRTSGRRVGRALSASDPGGLLRRRRAVAHSLARRSIRGKFQAPRTLESSPPKRSATGACKFLMGSTRRGSRGDRPQRGRSGRSGRSNESRRTPASPGAFSTAASGSSTPRPPFAPRRELGLIEPATSFARKGRLPPATRLVSERSRDSRALRRLSAVHGSRAYASRLDCQASAGRYRVAGWSGQGAPHVTQPGRRPGALTT